MRYRLLDVLACPVCRGFPLKLIVFKRRGEEPRGEERPQCELYCGLLERPVSEIRGAPCSECLKVSVEEGALYCERCGRWYPIIDEIPELLPDELRDERRDVEFAVKHGLRVKGFILERTP